MKVIQGGVFHGLSLYSANPERRIEPGDSLVDDLGMDSIDLMEFAIELEEQYDIAVTDDEIEKVQTAGDVVSLVELKLAA